MFRRHGGPGMHGTGGIPLAAMGGGVHGLVPNSLLFAGAEDVNCGTGASVMNLHAGQFTVDVYWRLQTAMVDGTLYCLVSQGAPNSLAQGWTVEMQAAAIGNMRVRFGIQSGGTVNSFTAVVARTLNAWYYIRCRKDAAQIHASINAGVESATVYGLPAVNSAAALQMAQNANNANHFLGAICYVHLWNTDKGALAAVPVSPFAIDANTVARYLFTDGGGAVLTDSSGNANHGTITGATWQTAIPAGWTL